MQAKDIFMDAFKRETFYIMQDDTDCTKSMNYISSYDKSVEQPITWNQLNT